MQDNEPSPNDGSDASNSADADATRDATNNNGTTTNNNRRKLIYLLVAIILLVTAAAIVFAVLLFAPTNESNNILFTVSPTGSPTNGPSMNPSALSSARPSFSVVPTVWTSTSVDPSLRPSRRPTGMASGSPSAPTTMPSSSPSDTPSLPPSTVRQNTIMSLLIPLSGTEPLGDVSSPQYQAAMWVTEEDELSLPPDSPRLLQRYFLAVFYFALDGDNSWVECSRTDAIFCAGNPSATAWLLGTTSECTWLGITCNGAGEVQRIFFSRRIGNGLEGTLPFELSLLSNIEVIILQRNSIGGPIPTFLGQLSKLSTLVLFGNRFTGTISEVLLGGLRLLGTLYVGENDLTGTIPTILGALPLVDLRMERCKFDGTIPDVIGSIPSLQVVELQENRLTGQLLVPLFSNPTITRLRLNRNSFTGSIPSEILQMASLEELNLQSNDLTGSMPTEMYQLPALSRILVGDNQLTGTLSEDFGLLNFTATRLFLNDNSFDGPIPAAFDQLTKLNMLILHGNTGLTGTISAAICAEKGNLFFDLQNLTAPLSVSCACCDLQV